VSLYREPGRVAGRRLAIVAAVAVVVGLAIGFAIGRSTAPSPSLADKVGDLRSQLQPARQGIELTATEYSTAVRGGKVVQPTEYGAAQSDVKRARQTIAGAEDDLRALNAVRAAAVVRSMDALAAAVAGHADPAQVKRLSTAADAAIIAAVGR
jgi:hypothetical protein